MKDGEIKLGEIIEIRFSKDSKEFWEKAKKIVDMFLEDDAKPPEP